MYETEQQAIKDAIRKSANSFLEEQNTEESREVIRQSYFDLIRSSPSVLDVRVKDATSQEDESNGRASFDIFVKFLPITPVDTSFWELNVEIRAEGIPFSEIENEVT